MGLTRFQVLLIPLTIRSFHLLILRMQQERIHMSQLRNTDALVDLLVLQNLVQSAGTIQNRFNDQCKHKIHSKDDLPSYPSEDAVLAGVTAELMKLFFPTEIAFVEQKAADEKESSLASGRNTRSDWTAGEALGRQIETYLRHEAEQTGPALQ